MQTRTDTERLDFILKYFRVDEALGTIVDYEELTTALVPTKMWDGSLRDIIDSAITISEQRKRERAINKIIRYFDAKKFDW